MADDPGPFAHADPLPIPPRILRPHEFEGLYRDLAGVVGGVDTGLGIITATLAPAVNTDIDPTFPAQLGAAVEGLDALALHADAVDLANIVGNGNAIDGSTDAQQRDLPGPNETEPPTADPAFEHEPAPPGGPDEDQPPRI
jgi:hypothetical protein